MSSDERNPKPEKSSTPPPDQSNVHVYPDWAAMQAYYGPRGCMPPYFNPAVAPGHPHPPYMWGPPQHMMPPYGPPYAAIYAPGGVYPHPGMPLAAAPSAETPTKPETPTKSTGNTDQGLMKKLKGFDGLAMSIGTGNAESAEDGSKSGNSQSTETQGSSNGSYGNTTEEDQKGRKRDRDVKSATGGDRKQTKNTSLALVEVNEAVGKATHANTTPSSIAGTETALDFQNPPTAVVKTSPANSPQPWLQNDKELKREKRKQSNRESARRSRLRKQAETEELAKKVEALMADNSTLRYELNRLSENSEKLKLENAKLMENLKNAQGGRMEQLIPTRVGEKRAPITTENLLSRVDNATGSVDRGGDEGSDIIYEKSSKSGGKLHQLLHPNPRADAVVAG